MKAKKHSRRTFSHSTNWYHRKTIKAYHSKCNKVYNARDETNLSKASNASQKKLIQLSSFVLKSEVIGSIIQSIVLIFGALLIPFIFTIVQDHNSQIKNDIAHKEKILEQFISNFSPSIGYYYKYASRTLWLEAQNGEKNGLYFDGSSFEDTTRQKQFYFDKYNNYIPYDFILNQILIEYNNQNISNIANSLINETDKLFQVDFSNTNHSGITKQTQNEKLEQLKTSYNNIKGQYNTLTKEMINNISAIKNNAEDDRLRLDARSLAKYLKIFFNNLYNQD